MKRDVSQSETNKLASKHLGSKGSYDVQTEHYDSSLLVSLPRAEARKDWGITGQEFYGFDVWHCYESTFLLNNGMPLAGTLKIVYPSYSECIVESKSFKLYLNSFDMCKMGKSLSFATMNYEKCIREDLEKLLGVDVSIKFHGYSTREEVVVNPLFDYEPLEKMIIPTIDQLAKFSDYRSEDKYEIFTKSTNLYTEKVKTNTLRSRCRHTGQKDTGTFFGYYEGMYRMLYNEMLRKVVSLRMLEEFHEFCCEKLFVDTVMKDSKVMIALLYSRRGSLDITPIRATSLHLIPVPLIDVNILTKKTMGQ